MLPFPALPSQRQVRTFLAPHITAAAQTPGLDRYRKSFLAEPHLWIVLLHVLLPSESLRQSHALLAHGPGLAETRNPDGSLVSFSQLARSSTSRDPAGVATLLAELRARLQHQPPAPLRQLLDQVQVLDSTFLPLSPTRSPWSQPSRTHPGAWLQLGLALDVATPSLLELTTSATNDVSDLAAMDLGPLLGQTLVFDLGYYAHRQFARLRRDGVHFITRRKPQATVRVLAPLPHTPPPESGTGQVLADDLIRLGSSNNRAGTVLHGLRRVRWQAADGRVFEFLTDRFDLPPGQVAWLYRQRWTIERYFRFLKRTVGLIRPLGTSREALWLTILICLVVALVLLLLAALPAGQWPGRPWVRLLGCLLLATILNPG